MEFKEPFKLDKKGLWYIDSFDVNTKEITFSEVHKDICDRITFYLIDGIDDYIIKDSTTYPYFFNRYRNLKLLKELVKRQSEINNVDFPVGYYKSLGILKGIIIPYYKGAISLSDLLYFHSFNGLKNVYEHDSDDINNLIALLIDILDIINSLYEKKIYYLDIRAGNFLIYQNNVKLIDFEPGYVYFKDKSGWYHDRMIKNYEYLVHEVCRKLGFKDPLFNAGNDFYDAKLNVKSLSKRLER